MLKICIKSGVYPRHFQKKMRETLDSTWGLGFWGKIGYSVCIYYSAQRIAYVTIHCIVRVTLLNRKYINT